MKLNIGIIGMSEGNGHPYSWSAIFNGYDEKVMANCMFPVIPKYLSQEKFPENFLTEIGEVTHIWTQDEAISRHIADACKIANIVGDLEDLIGKVDAVILARDDAENHLEFALPFIKAGLPIFIDKPFALSVKDALLMLNLQHFQNQIFTCSSLRYSEELMVSKLELEEIGKIKYVEGVISKNWETYGIHILEPILIQLPNRGKLVEVKTSILEGIHTVSVKWENCLACLKITGIVASPIKLNFVGEKGIVEKVFTNSFVVFKESLRIFIENIGIFKELVSRKELLEIVEIIERGRC